MTDIHEIRIDPTDTAEVRADMKRWPGTKRSISRYAAIGMMVIATLLTFSACGSDRVETGAVQPRVFASSFESANDFDGFYIAPQNHLGTSSHDLSQEIRRSGTYAHKAWIYGANPPSTPTTNNNHRAYPTVQLYKTGGGAFRTPVLIEFWVWLDATLAPGEWFSFATLDHTTSDVWDAVLVNLSDQGFVHLMHVPYNGQGERTFQTSTIQFPMRQWVKLTVLLHFDQQNGYAKVWQDDQLVSSADVRRGSGLLTQAHFGLYAPPSLSGGVIFNDDLSIRERPRIKEKAVDRPLRKPEQCDRRAGCAGRR